jgi:DNA-binding transcriptional LysR family regulator
MTLQQLSYFLASARLGSFSAAADELRLTQPGVSDQVRRLERELGMALFTRVGRGLILTPAGRTFQPYAEHVLAAVERAAGAVTNVRTLKGGVVTFGLFRNADYFLLPRLAAEFHRRYPTVRLRLVGQNSGETAEEVRAGRLEAAIIAGPVDPAGLEVRPIAADEVLVVGTRLPGDDRSIALDDLARTPLILYDAQYEFRDTTRRQLEEQAQRAGVKLEPAFDLEHVEGALALAAQGLGNTLATRAITRHRSFPEQLRTAPMSEPIYDWYTLVHRPGAPLTPAARVLAEIAERILADLDPRS